MNDLADVRQVIERLKAVQQHIVISVPDREAIDGAVSALESLAAPSEVERYFPVQNGPNIPWSIIAPFEKQHRKQHGGQTLERMAQRGGLSVAEVLSIIEGGGDFDAYWSQPGRDVKDITANIMRLTSIVGERGKSASNLPDIEQELRVSAAMIEGLQRKVQDLASDRVVADTEASRLRGELAQVDAVLARRPALDKSTRVENIEHACATAGRMTDRVHQLEREVDRLKAQLEAKQTKVLNQHDEIERLRADLARWIAFREGDTGVVERLQAFLETHKSRAATREEALYDRIRTREAEAAAFHPAPSGWQQRIAAIDPWSPRQWCFFCGTRRPEHRPDCLWQNAVDALPPASEGKEATHEWVSDTVGPSWCRHCGRNAGNAQHPCPRQWPDAKDAIPPGPEGVIAKEAPVGLGDLSADERLLLERHTAEWHDRLKPHRDAIRESERITRADLDIIVRSSEADVSPVHPCRMCGGTGIAKPVTQAEVDEANRALAGVREMLADASPVKEERE